MPQPWSGLVNSTEVSTMPAGSPAGVQAAPSLVRSSEEPATAQPCWSSTKSNAEMLALPLYCWAQVEPPSLVAMIAPRPPAHPCEVVGKATASRPVSRLRRHRPSSGE
jgi:hypothetical protein